MKKFASCFMLLFFVFSINAPLYAQASTENSLLLRLQEEQNRVVRKILSFNISIEVRRLLDIEGRPAPPEKEKSSGSGFVITKSGHVLSNTHVVDPKGIYDVHKPLENQPTYYAYNVTLSDGSKTGAKLIAIHDLYDIAVLRLTHLPSSVVVAQLGDSDAIKSGDIVYAVGAPLRLRESVSTGIVSNPEQTVPGEPFLLIQTDAAVNPGNSGGALANVEAEVVGINQMIYSKSGLFAGLSFAIPINTAKRFLKKVTAGRRVQSGWLGISVQSLDAEMRSYVEEQLPPRSSDLYVTNVAEPAKDMIQEGDIIITVDKKVFKQEKEFIRYIRDIGANKEVAVALLRAGKVHTVIITTTPPPTNNSDA